MTNRAELLAQNNKGETLISAIADSKRDKKYSGMQSLFGGDVEIDTSNFKIKPSELDMSIMELNTLGIMLRDPFNEYWWARWRYCNCNLMDISEIIEQGGYEKEKVFICIVTKIEPRTSKSGNNYIKLHVCDYSLNSYIYISQDKWSKISHEIILNHIYIAKVHTDSFGMKYDRIAHISKFEQPEINKVVITPRLLYGNWRKPFIKFITNNVNDGNIRIFINDIDTKILITPNYDFIKMCMEYELKVEFYGEKNISSI